MSDPLRTDIYGTPNEFDGDLVRGVGRPPVNRVAEVFTRQTRQEADVGANLGDAFEGPSPSVDPKTGKPWDWGGYRPPPKANGLPPINESGPPEPPPKPRFVFDPFAVFMAGDYRPQWLVKRIMVQNQPALIAGPSKGMKTSLLVDLAISLASGRPFLGTFPVPEPRRVVLVSGESGPHTLKETASRVCRAKAITHDQVGDNLFLCQRLPAFDQPAVMADFAVQAATQAHAEVALIDPLYLCLGASIDAKNMFEVGPALAGMAEMLLGRGITPVLVHHANRQLPPGEPMDLQHLAYAGLEQFARQFLLINRRERYRPGGRHPLWLSAGGSIGHGGLWGVDIEEGTTGEDFGGREWNVSVQTADELRADADSNRDDKTRGKWLAEDAKVLKAIDALTGRNRPATITALSEEAAFSKSKLRDALERLEEGDVVERYDSHAKAGKGAKHPVVAYRRFIPQSRELREW